MMFKSLQHIEEKETLTIHGNHIVRIQLKLYIDRDIFWKKY